MRRELDVEALYAAVESKKGEERLSWRALAEQLELGDHTVFTRLSKGQTPEANTLLSLTAWLGVPLERFSHGDEYETDSRRETMEAVQSFLRADKSLPRESADAISSVLRAAYDQLRIRDDDGQVAGSSEPRR